MGVRAGFQCAKVELLMNIIEVLGKIASEQMDERVETYLKTEYERGNDKVKKAIKKFLKEDLCKGSPS